MICAPVSATVSGNMAFTVAAVPTGMKTGVSMTPCAVVSRPRRAAPSRATMSKPIVTRLHPEVEQIWRLAESAANLQPGFSSKLQSGRRATGGVPDGASRIAPKYGNLIVVAREGGGPLDQTGIPIGEKAI